MKQKIGIILVTCLAFSLCMALSACVLTNKSLYVGTWELQDSNGDTFDSDTMELMKTLDIEVTLSLVDDNTGTLNYLGNDPHSVTWKASSNTEGELSVDEETYTLALDEGVLTMTDAEGTYMTFAKVSDEPLSASAAVSSAASEKASSASAEPASSESANAADGEGDEQAEGTEGATGAAGAEETEAAAGEETLGEETDEWAEGSVEEDGQANGEEGAEEAA